MRALRFHGRCDLRLDEIDEPRVRPGTVKLEVEWCGICGSDLHEYLSGPSTIPARDAPHPITGETMPVVMGHELAGRVVDAAPDVEDVAVGDRVAVEPMLRDGTCARCRRGMYNLCANFGIYGLSGGGGGLARYTVVPWHMVQRLP